MQPEIDIITLGCSKNLVDSEKLMGMFEAEGFKVWHDAELNDLGDKPQLIVVVNTCGFIKDAKEESINTILELAQAKDEGRIAQLYVMGCLSERYRKELQEEIPQVDRYFGKFDWGGLINILKEKTSDNGRHRHVTTPSHYAYLKISEGCNRHCAYCAIPIMTGTHKSRSKEDILDEVRQLVAKGVKEFQVIAQELTYYGIDIDGKQHIADLIESIAKVKGVEWIRLHYAYPTKFPMDLLRVIRENDNVCKYLDIAFQHISDSVLSRMQRHFTKRETYELIKAIRREVPGIHIRTTLMVGFPGETEEEFNELVEFVKEVKFERMGAFSYSEEDGTNAAEHYKDDVKERTKQRRLDTLMAVQQDIAAEVAESKVGKTMKVIIDSLEGDYYVGRTEYSSPEVDPEVLIPATKELAVGEFYNVTITDATEFDLYGDISDINKT
ncbi:MAG: 30S ribosomal protein S12 methylthiotransferase RimO [Prevotellaceae bacterium]|nr:30S ribosomal protein S12 methylthiotransferase RimO [Prevotellaceae bacterium]